MLRLILFILCLPSLAFGYTGYFLNTPYRVYDGRTIYGRDLNNPMAAVTAGIATLASEIQTGQRIKTATDTGTANAYVMSLPVVPLSFADGLEVWLKPSVSNSGPATLNLNYFGVKSIRNPDGSVLERDSLIAGYYSHLKYNGTYWQLTSNTAREMVSSTLNEFSLGNVAALQALTETPSSVYVEGRVAPGDGGQGFFKSSLSPLTAECTADPLHGIYIPRDSDPTCASGAYIRQHPPNIAMPEWYGDDIAAVQEAIDSLIFGDVILSKEYTGTRRVTMTVIGGSTPPCDAMLIPKSNVNLVGLGYSTGIKVPDGMVTAADYVVFGPVAAEAINNVKFTNFRINGNGLNNLHPGGGATRREMAIWLYGNDGVTIEGMWFENNPGTNTIKLGNDSVSYQTTKPRIAGNYFRNQGGGITGNREQTDHSTMYISGNEATVIDNKMYGADAPINGITSPAIVVAGIEMHGDNHKIIGNHIENYITLGYSVSDAIYASDNHIWSGNTSKELSGLGISLWSIQLLKNITITDNIFSFGSFDQMVAGVFQSLYIPDTTEGIENLVITGNTITSTQTAYTITAEGIFLTAVDGGIIKNNIIENMPEAAVKLYRHETLALDIKNLEIKDNLAIDCNMKEAGYAFMVVNDGTGEYRDIVVDGNKIKNTGVRTRDAGGITVSGTGAFFDIKIGNKNTFTELPDTSHWINVASGFQDAGKVEVEPRFRNRISSNLTAGLFVLGHDIIWYTNPSGGASGVTPALSGGASASQRIDSTAYTKGQWIRTAAGKVMECLVAGTTGTVDPNASLDVLGESVTDGTVTWIYRAANGVTSANNL